MADEVDHVAGALAKPRRHHVDPYMGVLLENIGGGEHEHGAKQQRLKLEPGVGTHVEGLADDGIAGADDHRRQDQPANVIADKTSGRVDDAAQCQKPEHSSSPGAS